MSPTLPPWRCSTEYARGLLSFVGYGHASEVLRTALQGGDAVFPEGSAGRADSRLEPDGLRKPRLPRGSHHDGNRRPPRRAMIVSSPPVFLLARQRGQPPRDVPERLLPHRRRDEAGLRVDGGKRVQRLHRGGDRPGRRRALRRDHQQHCSGRFASRS